MPYESWHAAVFVRRSRRRFDPSPLEDALLERMRAVCAGFQPFPGVRAVLVTRPAQDVFKGLVGGYGKIKSAPAFIAFASRQDDASGAEKTGYLGEGIVLEATALGLGTCWVGGFFRPETAAALSGAGAKEVVLAVTPLGRAATSLTLEERTMTGFGRSHRRRPLAAMAAGLSEEGWPEWVRQALAAARLAPSAVNRQPWRFTVEENAITVAVDSPAETYHIPKRLDCGIAMLHLELGAKKAGRAGRWELLSGRQVARFTVESA